MFDRDVLSKFENLGYYINALTSKNELSLVKNNTSKWNN